MEKYRAIPPGFMTVGVVAKKMGVTVRTLQYYDKEGLLPPSAESDGGRRLYTHQDIVKLHQILSMKYLGFSLEEIKAHLSSVNSPEEASNALLQHASGIRSEINVLTTLVESIEKLSQEVLQTETMDWEKYADILLLLREKNKAYWLLKHFSDNIYGQIRNIDEKTAKIIMTAQNKIFEKAGEFGSKGIKPESEQGQALAKEFWEMVMLFTQGDKSLMSDLIKLADIEEADEKWKSKLKFIEKAVDVYFANLGVDPFGINQRNDLND